MNGITELAKMLKARENDDTYSPMFGKIISLPTVKIRMNEKVILTGEHIKSIIDLDEKDEYGRYINLNKDVVLLPYSSYQKYVVLGVIQ